MSSAKKEPEVGDMVQVFLSGIPSVGIVFSIKGDTVVVKGSRWEAAFSKDEVVCLVSEEE